MSNSNFQIGDLCMMTNNNTVILKPVSSNRNFQLTTAGGLILGENNFPNLISIGGIQYNTKYLYIIGNDLHMSDKKQQGRLNIKLEGWFNMSQES